MIKRHITFILTLMMVYPGNTVQAEGKVKFVRINIADKNKNTIQALRHLKLDVAYQNRQEGYMEAIVDEKQLDGIQKLGFSSESIIEELSSFEEQLRISNYFDPFHSYEEMVQEMQQFQNDHPDISKMQSLGKSWEGRDIWAIKISDNVAVEEANEAEALFMANIHAREMITPEIIMYFMHWLIGNYNIDPRATYLVNNRQLWLIPTTNPDGRVYVFTGDYSGGSWQSGPIAWRKNKRDNNENNQFDSYYDGVDLNRNFSYMWGLDSGSSSYYADETYRGPEPFSEPESQAIKTFVESHHFVVSLSYHSYGRWWIFPWGHTNFNPDTPDHAQFVALADSCTAYNGYTPANGDDFDYLVSGDTDDWLYGEQTTKNKIFAFTPEVGSPSQGAFWPDTSLLPQLIEENMGPNIFLAYAAGEEPIIEHKPFKETESEGPYQIIAKIKPPIVLTTPVPLNPSSYKLFYNMTGIAPFDSISLQATGNPDEFIASIPSLHAAKKIYYYLCAMDQNSRTGFAPKGAPMTTYSFKISADSEAPKIETTPFANASAFAMQYLISAFVTDNIGISSVKLLCLKDEGTTDTLAMTLTSVPSLYQGIIVPENVTIGDTVKYQILAIDNSKNLNTTLMPPNGFFQFYLKNSIIFDFELEQSLLPIMEGDWQWGIPTSGPKSAHSGVKVWATNLSGDYSDETESILETPEISLADKDSATLIFWHWYQNEYSENNFRDGGNIKISVNGDPFDIITPENGYDGIINPYNDFLANEPCFGGSSPTGNFWHQEIFNLMSYINQNIKIRFYFVRWGD